MQWDSISIELDLASVQWACGKKGKTNMFYTLDSQAPLGYYFAKLTETEKADYKLSICGLPHIFCVQHIDRLYL